MAPWREACRPRSVCWVDASPTTVGRCGGGRRARSSHRPAPPRAGRLLRGQRCATRRWYLLGLARPVWSNTPLDKRYCPHRRRPPVWTSVRRGTQGPAASDDRPGGPVGGAADVGDEPDVAVVVLDVVLGYGSIPIPPRCWRRRARNSPGRRTQVVVYLLGTDADPQDLRATRLAAVRDRRRVAPTGARAALTPRPSPGATPGSSTPSAMTPVSRASPWVRRPKVGLVTYSTKPRGGVVHTLALAEELPPGWPSRSWPSAIRTSASIARRPPHQLIPPRRRSDPGGAGGRGHRRADRRPRGTSRARCHRSSTSRTASRPEHGSDCATRGRRWWSSARCTTSTTSPRRP